MIPYLKTFQVVNYKSLASVSVSLDPFTVFVGPNGSGKSNLIDAIAFVQESLVDTLDVAVRRRGGVFTILGKSEPRKPAQFPDLSKISPEELQSLLARSADISAAIGFRLILDLGGDGRADYALALTPFDSGVYYVSQERCVVEDSDGKIHEFDARAGKFETPIQGLAPQIFLDRLVLPVASSVPPFRTVFNFLASMMSHSISPDTMRDPQAPDPGLFLKRNGSNAVAVLKTMERCLPADQGPRRLLVDILKVVSEGITNVWTQPYGTHETMWFQEETESGEPRVFPALSMSDGTLRVLGLLLALLQPGDPKLVAIEEPENTVQPSLSSMIMELLMDASAERQVLVTTHSPDLLNIKELRTHHIRLVNRHKGETHVLPLPESLKGIVADRIYMLGELLSMGEMRWIDDVDSALVRHPIELFGTPFSDDGGCA